MPEPKVHAVEMVRCIREEHYARLKNLAPSEKIASFRKKAVALHAELERHDKVLEHSKRPRIGRA